MDVTIFEVSQSLTIAAPAEELYEFIADMTSMGEISKECRGGEWASDDRGVGALFIGSNKTPERSWQRRVRLAVVDPPNEFAFENLGDPTEPVEDQEPVARWTYRFKPVEGGTEVTEHWVPFNHPRFADYPEERFRAQQEMRIVSMRHTLESLKKVFEK